MREHLGLETFGDGVVELDLGIERVEGGPCLGEGQACTGTIDRQYCDGSVGLQLDYGTPLLGTANDGRMEAEAGVKEWHTRGKIGVFGLNLKRARESVIAP